MTDISNKVRPQEMVGLFASPVPPSVEEGITLSFNIMIKTKVDFFTAKINFN
jgi:hypothetical protein